jgi:hypothetical protein
MEMEIGLASGGNQMQWRLMGGERLEVGGKVRAGFVFE